MRNSVGQRGVTRSAEFQRRIGTQRFPESLGEEEPPENEALPLCGKANTKGE